MTSASDLCVAVRDLQQQRLPGRAAALLVPVPQSWLVVADLVEPRDVVPAVQVWSRGLDRAPARQGRGDDRTYLTAWLVSVGVWVRGAGYDEATTTTQQLVAAARDVLLAYPSLDGAALDVQWRDERYDLAPRQSGRTLAAGRVDVAVIVQQPAVVQEEQP